MAITTAKITPASTYQSVYSSSNDSAITNLTLCNTSGSAVVVDIRAVPDGETSGAQHQMISSLSIAAHDTYVLYSGGEKILLSDGDDIEVQADTDNVITAIVSYTSI